MSANTKKPAKHPIGEVLTKRRRRGAWVPESSGAPRALQPDSGVEWLVMLFLAGDNNLTEEMVLALQALMTEGAPEGDKIVAQLDPSGLGLPTQTYDLSERLVNGKPKLHLEDYLVEDYPVDETNTGNPDALAGFVKWANERYPTAKRHLLILSGHGSGTTEDFLLRDDSAMDSMTIDELGIALKTASDSIGRKIDILGMDACFMSMFEVADRISSYVDVLVGAEGLEPLFGWPYHRILRAVKAHREQVGTPLEPDQLAKAIVENYVEFYSDYDRSAGRSVDLAAIDLRQIKPLTDAMCGNQGLAEVLSDQVHKHHDRITLAHWDAQTYKADQFVDLHDLCVRIYKRFPDVEDVKQACRNVIQALDGGLQALDQPDDPNPNPRPPGTGCILLSGCSGFAYQFSYGISVYFPWAVVSSDYKKLTGETPLSAWATFLEKQIKETVRKPPRFNESSPIAPHGVDALARVIASRLASSLLNVLGEVSGAASARLGNPALEALANLLKKDEVKDGLPKAFQARFEAELKALPDMPPQDKLQVIIGKYTGQASKYTGSASKYTGQASKYTGQASKYTGQASKYASGTTRSAADREQSVKNLPAVIGKEYWPKWPD